MTLSPGRTEHAYPSLVVSRGNGSRVETDRQPVSAYTVFQDERRTGEAAVRLPNPDDRTETGEP